jgi:DNA polymerase-3 subunit gamma/tau
LSYQVLARKWRPKNFSDVLSQDHITRTLTNSILNDKVAHAYLLTGTRGIGKTTIARIFAKAIRCQNLSPVGEPCLTCDSCLGVDQGNSLDYIEIDGASNNSVDDIRELIDNVQYLPTTGKYKVYVIDEVHMLSVNAFNALLKTLEEPPEHVVFIFATTDPQKLLGTILSRCQRYDFKNAKIEDLENQIKTIATKEGITFEHEKLITELAKQGRGSFRDTLSLLDQILSLSASELITEETLLLSLGMAKTKSIKNIINGLMLKDQNLVRSGFRDVLDENVDLKNFSMQLLDTLFELLNTISESGEVSSDEFDAENLKTVSLIELMWIYETLLKDFEWALSSLDPEKALDFSLRKVSLREKILKQENTPLSKKKTELSKSSTTEIDKTATTEVVAEVETAATPKPTVVEQAMPETPDNSEIVISDEIINKITETKVEKIEPATSEPKSWEGFLKYLYESRSSASAVNLERGNLLNKENFGQDELVYKVAFEQDCRIFFDYLSEPEHKKNLIELLASYLGTEMDKVFIDFQVLDDETVQASNFKSSADVVIQNEKDIEEQRTNEILNNKYIKDAENIFNSKIDKVVLNEK